MTAKEKMLWGVWSDVNNDAELIALREAAEELCFELNHTSPRAADQKEHLLSRLLPKRGEKTIVLTPLTVDYGFNCTIGARTFINHNAYLMDGAPITIGKNCFIGPNLGCYTATHPLLASERNQGYEKARPITIGDDVWIGGDVTILPGVTIGRGAVIGAKSVVTKDIPPQTLAMGNPCRVVRSLTEADSIQAALKAEARD